MLTISEELFKSAFLPFYDIVSERKETQELFPVYINYLCNKIRHNKLDQTATISGLVRVFLNSYIIDRCEYDYLSNEQWLDMCKESFICYNEDYAIESFNNS